MVIQTAGEEDNKAKCHIALQFLSFFSSYVDTLIEIYLIILFIDVDG